jgi:zinc and cadmium transporter
VTLLLLVGFSLIGSVGAVVGAAAVLRFHDAVLARLVPRLLSYATGTMLGAAFLGLLPRALARASATSVMAALLGGVLLFFTLEKLMLWRHCHDPKCEAHRAARLVLMGDGVHNFLDGVVIGAAFTVGDGLGVAVALAVALHEVPQEVGDFAVLLEGGLSRRRAFVLNVLASLPTLPGALVAYFGLGPLSRLVPLLLALSAASFLYVAMSHLIPSLHRRGGGRASAVQLLLIALGVGTIVLLRARG